MFEQLLSLNARNVEQIGTRVKIRHPFCTQVYIFG